MEEIIKEFIQKSNDNTLRTKDYGCDGVRTKDYGCDGEYVCCGCCGGNDLDEDKIKVWLKEKFIAFEKKIIKDCEERMIADWYGDKHDKDWKIS
jgi:hypothetical protein